MPKFKSVVSFTHLQTFTVPRNIGVHTYQKHVSTEETFHTIGHSIDFQAAAQILEDRGFRDVHVSSARVTETPDDPPRNTLSRLDVEQALMLALTKGTQFERSMGWSPNADGLVTKYETALRLLRSGHDLHTTR